MHQLRRTIFPIVIFILSHVINNEQLNKSTEYTKPDQVLRKAANYHRSYSLTKRVTILYQTCEIMKQSRGITINNHGMGLYNNQRQ